MVGYSGDNLEHQISAETLKAGVEKLNPKFHVHLNPLANKKLFQEIEKRRLSIWVAGYYADYPDAHSFGQGLLHSGSYFPYHQGFKDPRIDELLERAPSLPAAERREAYIQVDALAAETLPQVYTYAPQAWRVCREGVNGFDSSDNVNNLNFNNFPYFYAYSKKP
jgi:peptide/nickel transport system substrate-binding protein